MPQVPLMVLIYEALTLDSTLSMHLIASRCSLTVLCAGHCREAVCLRLRSLSRDCGVSQRLPQ